MTLLHDSLLCISVRRGAAQVDEPEVWSELGHSQLEHNNVADAIECYLRANDSSR